MKKALVIEDDPLMGGIYCDKLRAIGFDVDLAGSGPAALEMLQRNTPDCVVLDLMLGGINGVKVIEFMRSQPATRSVPVVVLSNAYMGDLVQAAWKAGASKVLSKMSCSPNRLIEEVRSLLPADAPNPPAATITPLATAPVTANLSAPAPGSAAARCSTPPAGSIPAELRGRLTETIRTHLGDARVLLGGWGRLSSGDRTSEIAPLFRAVHAIAGAACPAGFTRLAQVATALEALLREVQATAGKINPSVLRTITQAVELLPSLFKAPDNTLPEAVLSPLVLVIDDDPVSRETLRNALERAGLHPLTVENPGLALPLFDENTFDLVFLDIDMPGMSGFEVCTRLHESAANQMTPVVFVTALSDFQTRNQFAGTGAVDFIAKPVGLVELAAKALVHLHRGRLLSAM